MSRVRVCALTDVLGLDPLRQSLVHVMSDLWLGEGERGGCQEAEASETSLESCCRA